MADGAGKRTTTEPKAKKPHPVWLCVFETTCLTVPRRFPDKPHVKVEPKRIEPGPKLDDWLRRAQAGDQPELVRVLYELMPKENEPGGLRNPFESPRDKDRIKKAASKRREDLECDGFTIGSKTDFYSVYVIKLKDGHLINKPAGYLGHVYVGQTGIPVLERVRQHQLGDAYPWKGKPNHSPDCHEHFVEYVPDLIPKSLRRPIPCRRKALWAERDLRLYLEKQGYKVIGGTDLLPKKPKKKPGPTTES